MPAMLVDKHAEAVKHVEVLQAKAADAYKELKSTEEKVLAAEGPVDPKSAEFAELDAAGQAHDKVADELADAKSARDALSNMLARESGRKGAPGGDDRSGEGMDRLQQFLEERGLAGGSSKPVSERVVSGEEYRALKDAGVFESTGRLGNVRLGKAWDREELKALISSAPGSAGTFITPDRQGYYPKIQRPLTVSELITVGATDSNLVEYVKQLTEGHNVGIQANEGDPKPESAYTFELVQAAVKTLAHWIPASKQALADVGQLRTLIDQALRAGLAQYVEDQVVKGTGVGSNLRGILQTTGVALAPVGANKLETVHHAITAVRLARLEPTAVGFHPEDWEDIRLSREATAGEDTATGGYLMGSPITSGVGVSVWGLAPAVSTAFPKGKALIGDYSQATLWLREGASVLASDSHADFFTKNLVAILAEMRAAFGVPRPDAFAVADLS